MSAVKLVPATDRAAIVARGGCPVELCERVWFLIDGPRLPMASGTVVCVSVDSLDDGAIDWTVCVVCGNAVYECDWQSVFVEASK